MTNPTERKSAPAYTRDSVDAYLRAAAAERLRIELAITEARARTERALRNEDRLGTLEGGASDPVARSSEAQSTESDQLIVQLRTAMAEDESMWLQPDAATGVSRD